MLQNDMVLRQTLFDRFFDQYFPHLHLDDASRSALSALFSEKKYPRKTFLLRSQDRWDKVFYIRQGLIRLFYSDTEGREFNKAFFWENHCIWPVAKRDRHETSLFNIDAIEETWVLECSFQPFFKWMNQKGYWERFALPFAETLVEEKFLREHDFLLHSATDRFKKLCRTHPDLVLRLPDYHLASYLGITSVSLSRIKKSIHLNK